MNNDVIATTTHLLKNSVLIMRRHPRRYVEDHFGERRGKVRRRFPGRPVPLQSAEETGVRFQFDLPGQSSDEVFERLTSSRVAEYRLFVLLAGSHVDNRDFVRFSAFL